jgi:hypothetical protein
MDASQLLESVELKPGFADASGRRSAVACGPQIADRRQDGAGQHHHNAGEPNARAVLELRQSQEHPLFQLLQIGLCRNVFSDRVENLGSDAFSRLLVDIRVRQRVCQGEPISCGASSFLRPQMCEGKPLEMK